MTLLSNNVIFKSKETTCNNSTRNCVVYETSIPGKAGLQISITKVNISIANEKDGLLSTCYITVESSGNEKLLAKWSNSKADYTPRNAPCEYAALVGADAKIRIYLKTGNKKYSALAKGFSATWEYKSPGDDSGTDEPDEIDSEPVQEVTTTLVVKCPVVAVAALTEEIKKLVPTAEVSTLPKTGT